MSFIVNVNGNRMSMSWCQLNKAAQGWDRMQLPWTIVAVAFGGKGE